MTIKTRIQDLARSRKTTLAELERTLNFGNGTINKWDKRSPSSDKLREVADYFDVTVDYLLGRTDTPQFKARDERDVQKTLEEMTQGLSNENALSYMKNGGEELSPEDAELLRASLENVIRQSKLIAKHKFTPKKYRKDQQD